MTPRVGPDWMTFAVALLVSAVLSLPILTLLRRWKSRQTVSEFAPQTHQAKQGTPTMGGLIILAGAAAAMVFCIIQQGIEHEKDLAVCLSLLVLFGLIGFLDDFVIPRMAKGKRGLGWKQKLALQFIAVFLTTLIGDGIGFRSEVGSNWVTFVGLVLFVLFFSNAYNFADGLDGLAAGLGLALFLPFGLLGFSQAGWAFVGAFIPFYWLNQHPAKVFMGDVGALPIGAVLGLLVYDGVLTSALPQGSMWIWLFGFLLLSLMMAAELLPVPLQILSVKLFHKKLFPYTPIHHAFERAGWKETRVTAMFVGAQALLSACFIIIILLVRRS